MYTYIIKEIIKIVDGDTVDLLIDLGFGLCLKQRVRLYDIDAPEISTKDLQEKKFGLECKEYLTEWLSKQSVLSIRTYKDDKYGRILGQIFGDNDVCINDLMVNDGYCWIYDEKNRTKDLQILLERRKNNI